MTMEKLADRAYILGLAALAFWWALAKANPPPPLPTDELKKSVETAQKSVDVAQRQLADGFGQVNQFAQAVQGRLDKLEGKAPAAAEKK